jgi:hypothetical protein
LRAHGFFAAAGGRRAEGSESLTGGISLIPAEFILISAEFNLISPEFNLISAEFNLISPEFILISPEFNVVSAENGSFLDGGESGSALFFLDAVPSETGSGFSGAFPAGGVSNSFLGGFYG